MPTVWSFAYAHTNLLKWWNDLFLFADRVFIGLWPLSSQLVSLLWTTDRNDHSTKPNTYSNFGTGVWAKAWTSIQKLLTWNLSAKSVICCFCKPALRRCLQKSVPGVFSYISSRVMKGQGEFKDRLLRGQISTISLCVSMYFVCKQQDYYDRQYSTLLHNHCTGTYTEVTALHLWCNSAVTM